MSFARPVSKAVIRWARSQEHRSWNSSSTSDLPASRARTKLPRVYSRLPHTAALTQRCFRNITKEGVQRHVFQSGKLLSASGERRTFSTSAVSMHEHLIPPKPGEELHVTFVDKDGDEHSITVSKGDNLLDIALDNDLEMEGACGGSCACSTCHIIVEDEALYDEMDEPDDDENDMLDLAFGLTETSRLGCQVKMRPELDGLRVRLPAMTRNLQASDFSKKNERSD